MIEGRGGIWGHARVCSMDGDSWVEVIGGCEAPAMGTNDPASVVLDAGDKSEGTAWD